MRENASWERGRRKMDNHPKTLVLCYEEEEKRWNGEKDSLILSTCTL